MTDQLQLIQTKLQHLARMQQDLAYSLGQVELMLPLKDWSALTPDQHESLAAFRVRFSEFQEHIGKAADASIRRCTIVRSTNERPLSAPGERALPPIDLQI